MLQNASKIIVGLSGGADSVALLHFMNSIKSRYGFELSAAHVNHMLRGSEADRDENFSRELCEKLGVELHVLKKDIAGEARLSGEGEEECGRRIRYEFFASLCAENTLIATAHTLSDSIETLIMNIVRGTGIHGLCGISAKRGNIIRPLIECTRNDIEEYCLKNGLNYVIDSSNLERDYRRNIIRLDIVPRLYALNPSLDKVILRMIRQNITDDDYLQKSSAELLNSVKSNGGYGIAALKDADDALLGRAISLAAKKECGVTLENIHIAQIGKIISSGSGSTDLPKGNTCSVKDGSLRFNAEAVEKAEDFAQEFSLGKVITPIGEYGFTLINADEFKKNYKKHLKNTLDYDMIKGKLLLRNRNNGDEIRLSGRNCTKTLKKLFNESKTDIKKRSELLILCDSEGLVWLQGFGCADRVKVTDRTKKVLKIDF